MNSHTFSMIFVIAQNRKRADEKAPLFCRITYKKKRKQFSAGIFVSINNWDNKNQRIKPPEENCQILNSKLSLIKQKINQAFLFLQVQEKDFDVEDVYLQYSGNSKTNSKTIINLFQEHNNKVEKLIGKDYAIATFWKFKQSLELLKSFIKFQYKKNDYQFEKLDLKFIQDYEFYLKTEKNLSQATINKAIQRFRRIVKIAQSEKIINADPFLMYRVRIVKKEIVFLSQEELKILENHKFSQTRLELVKDMFVFCCYTGLAYKEMSNLTKSNIIKGFDNKDWIQIRREKTNKQISIPLLQKSTNIIGKYLENKFDCGVLLFPCLSNQKFNSYLKEIADIVGISKNLTHHIARKTFATTILLYNDVPIEVVSELLGHSKITTTQEHYAKVVQKKISEQMINLDKKLKR